MGLHALSQLEGSKTDSARDKPDATATKVQQLYSRYTHEVLQHRFMSSAVIVMLE